MIYHKLIYKIIFLLVLGSHERAQRLQKSLYFP